MLEQCIGCLNHCKKPGYMNTLCLGCKRQYIGQEAENYKTDKYTACDERCMKDVTSCESWDTDRCKLHK